MLNEVIRITYYCNLKCNFCNIIETNNFEKNITKDEIINNIILKAKKNKTDLKNTVLTFSGGEPLLNKNIEKYIKMAQKIGFGGIELQTNGIILFKKKEKINSLINNGLDMLFIGQHSHDENINNKMGTNLNKEEFIEWFNYIRKNNIHKKLKITINIVITKNNIYNTKHFIQFLIDHDIIDLLFQRELNIGLVFPNGYARENRREVLLDFSSKQVKEIKKIVSLCERNNIDINFHFSAPPFCIIDLSKYSDEYKSLINNKSFTTNTEHILEDKQKLSFCKKCKFNDYCHGFNKKFLEYIGGKEKIKKILHNKSIFK
ncbi:radical SAM protein [Candidatus Absconditicoccus praedator]|uniref:radical SAM protein n=1 Tax=Candidatus Absconditicoccus praedator TaxID=2735562 RepID=UPI001E36B507|nr:radical SAM protein [Candidatus Absconditicoccus praedator]UFX83302.1 radical SAM protein [Candidatus Absconditicoccus praedator]